MRNRPLPADESSFYQRLRTDTLSSIFWERLELKTDSGFPDTNFVLRNSAMPSEGTAELKFQRTLPKNHPNLHQLMKGDQKANFLDYFKAGGRRRFLLCCNTVGQVHFYNTAAVCDVLLKKREAPMATMSLEGGAMTIADWLCSMLEM